MSIALALNLSALAALVPAFLLSLRRDGGRDGLYWVVLAIAVAGPLTLTVARLSHGWMTGFSVAVWISIAATMLLFAGLVLLNREAWRLTPLLLPYLLLLGVGATLFSRTASAPLTMPLSAVWLDLHILISVATYGLLTLAAIAGLSVFFQERALKRKQPTALSDILPSVADGEALQVALLRASVVVLGAGLVSGVATQFLATGRLLEFDHKTLFSLLAFATIAGVLAVHHRTGLRGRRATRIVLLGYLFLTLAYPGVKFVSDVLLVADGQ
jgi:ABC-type uncharacterized transport system permease subunit